MLTLCPSSMKREPIWLLTPFTEAIVSRFSRICRWSSSSVMLIKRAPFPGFISGNPLGSMGMWRITSFPFPRASWANFPELLEKGKKERVRGASKFICLALRLLGPISSMMMAIRGPTFSGTLTLGRRKMRLWVKRSRTRTSILLGWEGSSVNRRETSLSKWAKSRFMCFLI